MSDDARPPQSLEEKLSAPVKPKDNVARRTLKELRSRLWPVVGRCALADAPETLEFEVMGVREVWRRQGAGPASFDPAVVEKRASKEATVYELERKP